MTRKKYGSVAALALLCALITLPSSFAPAQSKAEPAKCEKPTVVDDPTYKPGQVWSYKNRPGEDASTITILKVETTSKMGTIVHVRIDKFNLENCKGNKGDSSMDHAPFSRVAINKSVVKLLRTEKDVPDFSEGYNDWLSHCGGIYTMPVAEALTLTNKTMKDHGCN
ncbi:hypothetical protein DYQ86_06060 [Acidobacteria bacterium AB60]|nr:hypothetical protein DYQ86_06060 [Acidobacteria bacterium AB60]